MLGDKSASPSADTFEVAAMRQFWHRALIRFKSRVEAKEPHALQPTMKGRGNMNSIETFPPAGSGLQPQSAPPQTRTTAVLVILTVKDGVTREQVMRVMPAEIRATVELYLAGKVNQWFSRGDGKGVVFLLDAKDVAEARILMEGLPLHEHNLMDHEYVSVGPLLPLKLLMAGGHPEK